MTKKMKPVLPPVAVDALAPFSLPVASALQAMKDGVANGHQQQIALEYIIQRFALTHEPAYRAGSDRDTAFMLGRQFVGQQILGFLKADLTGIDTPPAPTRSLSPTQGENDHE